MSFRSDIIGYLKADTAITAICPAASIYFGNIPRNISPPFILCQVITTNPANTFDQGRAKTTRLDNFLLQVTSYARTEDQSVTLANLIRKNLESQAAPRSMLQDQREDYDDFPDLFGQFSTYSSWYSSTV